MQIWFERAALAVAAALTAFTLTLVPSWSGAWADPCRQAAVAAAATIVLLFATRRAGPRAIPLEPDLHLRGLLHVATRSYDRTALAVRQNHDDFGHCRRSACPVRCGPWQRAWS